MRLASSRQQSLAKTVHDHLDALIGLLHKVEEAPAEFLEQAQALRARLGTGCLHLAVLGQFKRGKSTVINALLGKPLLPDGVLPVTAVPAFLYAGSRLALHVYPANPKGPQEQPLSALPDFVTESGNPQNRRRVRHVHLFFPAPLLQAGIVLIDTPGIGSTNENNTETTLRFLPRCDDRLNGKEKRKGHCLIHVYWPVAVRASTRCAVTQFHFCFTGSVP